MIRKAQAAAFANEILRESVPWAVWIIWSPSSTTAAHAPAPRGAALTKSSISPKDEFDTIAEAALTGEDPSIKKEQKAKNGVRYLSNKTLSGAPIPRQSLKVILLPR
jgi:hypothetical protein